MKRKEEKTGIFLRETISASSSNPKEFAELFNKIASNSIESDMAMIEESAKQVLADHKFPTNLKDLSRYPVNKLGVLARDAKMILIYIAAIRHAKHENDIDGAVWNSIRVGDAFCRLGVRPFEKPAGTGIKQNKGASLGGQTRKTDTQTIAAWLREKQRLINNNPKLTINAIAKRIHDNVGGGSIRTITKYIKES